MMDGRSRGSLSNPSSGGTRDVGVVIPAAGFGVRLGRQKTFLELLGRPLLHYTLRAFSLVEEVLEIAVAVRPEDLEMTRDWVQSWIQGIKPDLPHGDAPSIIPVSGGSRRQDSVWLGFQALSPRSRWILVHDAARPLIQPEDIQSVIAAVRESGAAVLGHPATDSVKEEKDGFVARELHRGQVWAVQTPQAASAELLRRAFEEGRRSGLEVTDEVGLLVSRGTPVRLVEGKRTNIKITFPEDAALAEFLMRRILAMDS